MLADDNFREKLTADLVRAGLPIASTYSATLSSGIRVESDNRGVTPACFLDWRVHSRFHDHFVGLSQSELLDDPQVRASQNTWRAMNVAITAILEFAGYQVREDGDERIGQLFVTRTAASSA